MLQTIDFTVANPISASNYLLYKYENCNFEPEYACWATFGPGSLYEFYLELPELQSVNLTFQLCSAAINGQSDCPIDITVNGQPIVTGFDPHIYNFYDQTWTVPESMLNVGTNIIILQQISGTTEVFIKYASTDIQV